MAIDGLFIHRLTSDLKKLEGARISRISNPSQFELHFTLHKAPVRELIINLDSNTNRIYTSNQSFRFQNASNFTMLLRKTIAQGTITSIEQYGLDRMLDFTIKNTDEIGVEKTYHLYVELMGKYANAILTENGMILDALKRISALDESRRMIYPGVEYSFPKMKPKKNPFTEKPDHPQESLVSQMDGFSPLLSREFQFRMKNGEEFGDILEELNRSENLYVYENQFHLLPLKHLNQKETVYPIMSGLERIYRDREEQQRTRQKYKAVFKTVDQEVKKLSRKIPKLQQSLLENENSDQYREYGDLIFSNLGTLEKEKKLKVYSYEQEKDIEIPIDMRFSLKDNANLFYKKYHKARRSLNVLNEQIEAAQKELSYFEQLSEQVKHAGLDDLAEIEQELIQKRYLMKKPEKRQQKKAPNILVLKVGDALIYVGKNNLQNEFLLRNVASKQDWWFHVKDYHGSHVVLKSEKEPDERLIRLSALLAAQYSKGKESSSLPVNYTKVSSLRRVKGSAPGFVTMKNYQTIYIDPDEEFIQKEIKEHRIPFKKG